MRVTSNDGDRIRVAVLFGGKSGEHEVSLASARSVMDALDRTKYEIHPVGIDRAGRWITAGDPMKLLREGEPAPEAFADEGEQCCDESALTTTSRRDLLPGSAHVRFPAVDVVFPVLHGTYGEDGTIQGLLELADLAYVGADVLGSAVGMDKAIQKAVLAAQGLPVVDYAVVLRKRWQDDPDGVAAQVEAQFAYPVFIKPANAGSSVGVSKARDREELAQGLDLAARFDRKLLVEAAVDAREIEVSVLGNDDPIASVPGEVIPSNEFYDYRAKYIDGDSGLDIPARLSAEQTDEIRELAIRAFQAIDCAGMARVDFFVEKSTGQIFVNELNTIPGFTDISMYPKLWEASGLPYPELLDRLINLALERRQDKRASQTRYEFDH
jgi:D-alanine-D-alanine ligase